MASIKSKAPATPPVDPKERAAAIDKLRARFREEHPELFTQAALEAQRVADDMKRMAMAFNSVGAWIELNYALARFYKARFGDMPAGGEAAQRREALSALVVALVGGNEEAEKKADRMVAALRGARDIEDESVQIRHVALVVSHYVNADGQIDVHPLIRDEVKPDEAPLRMWLELEGRFKEYGWGAPIGFSLATWLGAWNRFGVIARVIKSMDPVYRDKPIEWHRRRVEKAHRSKAK